MFLLSRYVEGNVINPEKLPLSVPEAGCERSTMEKENAVNVLRTLSYPVTESNHLRTPIANSSDTDTPGKLPYPIPEENKKKKTELGETEATCTSRTETTATTAVSQDAASSSIEGLVNCSSSERCTPLSGIREKLNHRKACEASRATGDLLQQHKCRDELKTSSECQQLDLEVSLVHPVWLHLLYGTDVQVSTTT